MIEISKSAVAKAKIQTMKLTMSQSTSGKNRGLIVLKANVRDLSPTVRPFYSLGQCASFKND